MKRDAQDIAIEILTGIVILLLAALLAVKLTGFRIGGNEPAPPPAPPETAEQKEDSPFFSEPEQILGSGGASDRDAESTLPVGDAEVPMTLLSGSFALRGGPAFSLYYDAEKLETTELGGKCYLQLKGGQDDDLYLELGFVQDAAAETLAPDFLEQYGSMTEDPVQEPAELGKYRGVRIRGSMLEADFEAFLLPADGGCVTLLLRTPYGAPQAQLDSLRASMQSIELRKS